MGLGLLYISDNIRDLTDFLILSQSQLEGEDAEMKDAVDDTRLAYTVMDVYGGNVTQN